MNRRTFLKNTAWTTGALGAAPVAGLAAQPTKRPNIVFIMVDQLHFNAISAYGNPYVKTLNLDRLVNEGFSFMKMHTVMIN
mgnify:CR=1 FL=1